MEMSLEGTKGLLEGTEELRVRLAKKLLEGLLDGNRTRSSQMITIASWHEIAAGGQQLLKSKRKTI